jgi:hypothetical protein
MSGIFISYRRDDSRGFAGRLADALDAAFGNDFVFRDIDDIAPGADFIQAITSRLASVDVVLVVIGPDWLAARNDSGRRLDDPADFVRLEIELALAAGKPLWPVLIGGAAMPAETALPPSLQPLARRQALTLADAAWRDDVDRLIAALRRQLPNPGRSRRGWLIASAVGLAGLLLGGFWLFSGAEKGTAVTGLWIAQVRYDWGAEHGERFDLQLAGGRLRGTASYLGLPRSIIDGQVESDGSLEFTTNTESLSGGSLSTLTHRYRGRSVPEGIRFVLETSGGSPAATPVEFIARRP